MTPGRRPGFTLTELVISLAILGVIMVGVSAALGLATSALPDDRTRSSDELLAALAQMRSDFEAATRLRAIDAGGVEICLPDRDADGRAEVVSYAWDGEAGSPLTRTYQGQSTDLLSGAGKVTFTSQTWTHSTTVPTVAPVTSASTLATVPADLNAGATTQNFAAYTGYGQLLAPTLPADAGVWTITQVRVLIREWSTSGSDSNRLVQIRLADEFGLPSSTVLFEARLRDISFSGDLSNWSTLTVSGMPYLLPTQQVCVCFINIGSDYVWQYDLRRTTGSGSGMSTSGNSGSNWTSVSNRSLFVRLVGSYVAPTSTAVIERTFTSSIGAGVSDALGQTRWVSTSLPNGCEVLADRWRTDFESNPTTQDVDGDGTLDWSVTSGSYADSDLSGGWLRASKAMALGTSQEFTQPTEISARLRITSNGQEWNAAINADKSGLTSARLTLRVDRTSSQVLRIRLYEAALLGSSLLLERSLPLDTVDLRCVIVPEMNVATLWVNEVLLGASVYTPLGLALGTPTPFAISGTSTSVLVDWVDLRVGGVTR